ncbi:MAG: exodeoxyribonuclease VII small subunit [Spirochaetaceae bacterium]|nr:MAG: exodeoxyribonuclease VII small subunit [Spirochaetaceae bacterium]
MKSFEDRLNRLETLSEKLREGKIPLEEAVSIFEEGMKLAKELEKELAKIERKVEILVNEPQKKSGGEAGEKPVLELFPELEEGEES